MSEDESLDVAIDVDALLDDVTRQQTNAERIDFIRTAAIAIYSSRSHAERCSGEAWVDAQALWRAKPHDC